jgi:hypothetical protein
MPLTEIKVTVGKKHMKQSQELWDFWEKAPYPKANYTEFCPIALALRERGYYATVFHRTAIVRKLAGGETVGCYKLPPVAQNFINKYDKSDKADPISFVLDDVGENDPPSAIEKERYEKDQNPEVESAGDCGHAEGGTNQDIGPSN